MTADDLDVEVRTLKKMLAQGEISEDEFWEELHHLERAMDPTLDMDASEVVGSVGRGFMALWLFLLPAIVGVVLLYFVFIYYPPPSDIGIRVESSSFMPIPKGEKETIYRALEFMREESPIHYDFVVSYVDTIQVAPPLGLSVFGVIRGYYRTDQVKSIRMVHGLECPAYCDGDGWSGLDLLTAEFILHEACHSMQHHKDIPFDEGQCYSMQFDLAKKVGPMLWPGFREEYFVWEEPSPILG